MASQRKSNETINPKSPALEKTVDAIRGLEGKIQQIEEMTDGFYVCHGFEMRERIKDVKAGGLVETPYVKEKSTELMACLRSGRPAFFHGELGGGKTELALQTGREFLIGRQVMRDMNAHAGEFIKTDESGKRSVDARAFRAEYERLTGYYKSELNSGNPDAVNQFEPLIVSGSKDTTTQDLYTETSLKVKNRFNGETIQQHNDAITAEQNEWKKANDQRLAAMSVSDREAEIQTNLEQISTLYIQKHSAFGTEVEKIEKEIACAIREGKPVVIDEINAIPVPVLVSLNHILTRRAGDTVNLLGSDEQMEVVDGFSIIMTGNLSRPGANYIGVNDLNPAFLSRLKIMHYDYLPQSTEGNIDQQSDPEKMNCFMFC